MVHMSLTDLDLLVPVGMASEELVVNDAPGKSVGEEEIPCVPREKFSISGTIPPPSSPLQGASWDFPPRQSSSTPAPPSFGAQRTVVGALTKTAWWQLSRSSRMLKGSTA